MERKYEILEKAIISGIMAVMLGFGSVAFFMGVAGVAFSAVNVPTLVLGYLIFCMAIWLLLLFPHIKN